MEQYILQTKDLCKNFGKQKSVNNVSITVEKGSIYGLLGPNGAGKSTLLKMLTGMLRPTSGDLFYDGGKWKRDNLANIGALIESPPLYDNLTARENLKVWTTIYGLPDERISEVLEIVNLLDTGKKKAGHFSMGMKQRLGIAIALVNQPQLLILDEPTNGLDPIGIQELRDLINSFPEQGITVIISSHILAEVEQVVTHIGILSDGILGFEGKLKSQNNLESLFMEVVKNNRRVADKQC